LVENSNQCNILEIHVKDLEKEVDILKDQVDENSNNIQSNMFETMSHGKGKPYNVKLRSYIYFLRSRQIGVEHIADIIKNVLSLVDVEVDQLPCTSTSLNLNSELGYITRKQIVEELDISNNLTMHRDATTTKGRNVFGVELSNGTNTYTVGSREVADGKSDTYTAYKKEILKDLNTSSSEIDNGSNILRKVKKNYDG
jgi:hypothetical protein